MQGNNLLKEHQRGGEPPDVAIQDARASVNSARMVVW
jgi:hypothetical protein